MQRYKEMNNENAVVTYEFYDDHFRYVSSNGSESTVLYSSIKKLVKTKKLILLTSKAKVVYWFPIDLFEIGNFEEFKQFLKSKGVKV